MKLLIVLISFLLICFSGCGKEEIDSTDNINTNGANHSPEPAPEPAPAPTSQSSLTDDPLTETPQQLGHLCTNTCMTDSECGQKYRDCLRPYAGEPEITHTTVCTNNNGDPSQITLVVNEWQAPSGQNKLLCDFIADNTFLYKFATVNKKACRRDMNARKEELTGLGYHCETPSPSPSPSPSSSPATQAVQDICSSQCKETQQCRTKYTQCLKPSAGSPETTQKTVCSKDNTADITFVLNKWSSSINQTNTLLCDLIRNDEMIRFATAQKNSCQLHLQEKVATLTDNNNYTCQITQ